MARRQVQHQPGVARQEGGREAGPQLLGLEPLPRPDPVRGEKNRRQEKGRPEDTGAGSKTP